MNDVAPAPIKFETWETLILSEQMPYEDIQRLMSEQPIFAEWYRKRAAQRDAKRRV